MNLTNPATTGETNFRVLDQYREESSWADKIGKTYHFPKKYLKLISQPNTRFIYHEPKRKGKGEYFGCGEIGKITPDPADPNQFFAEILNYHPFASPVSDSTEQGTPREQGPYYNAQNAVRKVEPELFSSICAAGGVAALPHETGPASAPLSPPSTRPNHWIFQGNPRHFDIDTYLKTQTEITWQVRRSFARVKPGDLVLIWRSGDHAGVVGEGSVESEATPAVPDDAPQLYRTATHAADSFPRCKVRLLRQYVARHAIHNRRSIALRLKRPSPPLSSESFAWPASWLHRLPGL